MQRRQVMDMANGLENLPSGHCRTAPRADGDVQLAVAFSGFPSSYGPERGLCGRGVPEMQREGSG